MEFVFIAIRSKVEMCSLQYKTSIQPDFGKKIPMVYPFDAKMTDEKYITSSLYFNFLQWYIIPTFTWWSKLYLQKVNEIIILYLK